MTTRLESGPAFAGPGGFDAVLDVRDPRSFAAGHLAGAGNLTADSFAERRTELPPREASILVVAADGEVAGSAAARLEALGYARVAWLDGPPGSIAGGEADHGPAARLWRPAPFLESVLPRLREGAPGRRVLDLAAGAGRESVHLALHGFEVEAVDDDPAILSRAEALARANGVTIRTRVTDLERARTSLGEAAYDVIVVFRFLHRPLFPAIVRALAPRGFLVYETFRRGQARFGRPTHPRFLLDDGELASVFPDLEVERFEEPNPEGGPVTARLLARKPAGKAPA